MGDITGILSIIRNINKSNVVDIIIVAYILYKLFILIHETRAEQLIKGLVFIIIVMKLSEVFGLITLYWLIQNTLTVGLIALIIIFQPELRKALEHLGRSKILTKKLFDTDEEIERVVDEITIAALNLSETKTGALIVIEQETGLNDFMESGIIVDAYVTSALLENIFVENTPLHDGAVIIRRDRIVAAACVLPLTEQGIDKELGTRHRAGVGVTENSDSIAVIVSEETGTISLAINGRITRNYTSERLKNVLSKALKHKVSAGKTTYKKVKEWLLSPKKIKK
jgi:diadenylate cyclase